MSTQPDTNDIITNDVTTNDVTTNDSSTSNKNNALSRRDFLKYSAGAVGAASLSGILAACSAAGFGGTSSSSGGGAVPINFWDMAWGKNSDCDLGRDRGKSFTNSNRAIRV